jgi:hypothetical protein
MAVHPIRHKALQCMGFCAFLGATSCTRGFQFDGFCQIVALRDKGLKSSECDNVQNKSSSFKMNSTTPDYSDTSAMRQRKWWHKASGPHSRSEAGASLSSRACPSVEHDGESATYRAMAC